MPSFTYSPLDPSRHEFRLVSLLPGEVGDPIECALRHFSLDKNPAYGALSYVWGDSKSKARILLDGHEFDVTENLGAALFHLRSATRAMILWIDAICINQGNITERNDQVRQMASIYKQALGVIVWLGRDSGNAQLAMDFVRDAISHENRFEWILRTLSNPELF